MKILKRFHLILFLSFFCLIYAFPFSGPKLTHSQKHVQKGGSLLNDAKNREIIRIILPEKLFSNPFVYKGEKISTCLRFVMMTAENEALFMDEAEDFFKPFRKLRDFPFFLPFMVSGVPTTAFTQGEYIVLTARVIGLTKPKGMVEFGFTVKFDTAPHLEYLDHGLVEDE